MEGNIGGCCGNGGGLTSCRGGASSILGNLCGTKALGIDAEVDLIPMFRSAAPPRLPFNGGKADNGPSLVGPLIGGKPYSNSKHTDIITEVLSQWCENCREKLTR